MRDIHTLAIPRMVRVVPHPLTDDRGFFFESFRAQEVTDAIGYPFRVAQSNYSVSRRGTVRGVHTATVPPGQAKLVTCVRGAVLDIAVDMRVGSPTFGRYEVTRQDAVGGVAVYIPEGVGHGFQALTDDACVNYLCSAPYVPGSVVGIDPLDPDLDLPWQLDDLDGPPVLSSKDAAAPTLAEALAAGSLPTWAACEAFYASRAAGTQRAAA